MNYSDESLKKHYEWRGKIEITPRCPLETRDDLSLAYTPGVAQPCLEIQKDINKSYELTRRSNLVAVITDGTAVLGLGDIGPEAGMPVMEGKCVLFKAFGGVDAIPLFVRSKDVDEIVKTVSLISGSFGGINLEDISAPRCFEIERRLKQICDIPIFHDDQHGTAVVTTAAVINALRVVSKKAENVRVVMSGAGAAGLAICKMLMTVGIKDILVCDRKGILCEGDETLNPEKALIAKVTNRKLEKGSLAQAMKDSDIFIGVSAPGLVSEAMVKTMADKPIMLPMANPVPEIMPDIAKKAGAAVVGTGRSDFPNQINNVLAFPGIFRGALDARASDINEAMKTAAANALADYVGSRLSADYIIPDALDKNVALKVAEAVYAAAVASGVSRI